MTGCGCASKDLVGSTHDGYLYLLGGGAGGGGILVLSPCLRQFPALVSSTLRAGHLGGRPTWVESLRYVLVCAWEQGLCLASEGGKGSSEV